MVWNLTASHWQFVLLQALPAESESMFDVSLAMKIKRIDSSGLSQEYVSEFAGQQNFRSGDISFRATVFALAVSCLLSPPRVSGQAGALDMNFAPRVTAPTTSVGAVALQPDGKLLVSGSLRIVGSTLFGPGLTHMVRLNPDGTLDPAFNTAAVGTPILQTDGRIVLTMSQSIIIRLERDGSLDPSLNLSSYVTTNSPFLGVYYTVVSQPDGKLIVGGKFSDSNRQRYHYLVRVNSDGTLDGGFDPDIGSFGPENYISAAALQTDGKMLIGGSFTNVAGTRRNQLARLNSDGSLDSSFDSKEGPDMPPSLILALPDGKVMIAGDFEGGRGSGLARLNSDGSFDTTFDPGTGIGGYPYAMAVQPDGKAIVGGSFTSYNGTTGISGIVRLNPDGTLDRTFNIGSGALDGNSSGRIVSVIVQSDNKIVVAGSFSSFNGTQKPGIARLNPDGSFDPGFNPDLEVPGAVWAVVVQSDGKPIMGLGSVLVDGIPRTNIARLNVDGSLDASFNANNSLTTGPSFIVPQPDGKLLIGHELDDAHGLSGQKILRLSADGNVDTSFSADTNTFIRLSGLLCQPDGKVLVGGMFKGTGKSGVVRLNEDGSSDANFLRGLGTAGSVSTVALQSEEKILVGGAFTNFNGVGRTNLVRLNADGTVDSSFIASGITNRNQTVQFVSAESDGKIVMLIGSGVYYNLFNNRLVRLNSNGSPDNSFTAPLKYVSALTNGRDGRIYCTGVTNNPVSYFTRSLFRLDLDGSVNPQFSAVRFNENPYAYGGYVDSLALEPDGLSLLLTGQFDSVNGIPRTWFARVFTVQQPSLSGVEHTGGSYRLLLTGETNRIYRIDVSTNLLDWAPVGMFLLTNSPTPFVDSNAANFGRQFYRATVVP